MNSTPTAAGAFVLFAAGLTLAGGAWAEEADVTMEVIEDPDARDLSQSHALELPEGPGEEARQGEGSKGMDRGARELAGEAENGGSQAREARELAEEAREHARDQEQARQDRRVEPDDAGRDVSEDPAGRGRGDHRP